MYVFYPIHGDFPFGLLSLWAEKEGENGGGVGQAPLVLGHKVLNCGLVPYSMYVCVYIYICNFFFFHSPSNYLLNFFLAFFMQEFFKMPLSSGKGDEYPPPLYH